MAIVVFGDGWHNNHHAFPSSAFHGLQWWEVDLHAYVIRALGFLHLAWDIRRPSEVALEQKSSAHNRDTSGGELIDQHRQKENCEIIR
jgi:stearoyl-CoA desaturase (delta-9 desaturase)